MAASPECILPIQNELGEGPRWNVKEQRLYWVDIERCVFHRLEPSSGAVETFPVGLPVGVLAFRAAGGLVLATREGFALWEGAGKPLRPIGDPEPGKPGARFNDGAVDRAGRFWAGTMTETDASSALYRLDLDLSIHRMEEELTISNGMGWSPDDRTLYHTDTLRHTIYQYDFDLASGEIANRRVFAHDPEEGGVPDGLAVDAQGFIWSARCHGGKIVRYDPQGKVERRIALPTQCPTSVAFGGQHLDELYITTSRALVPAERRAAQPLAGGLFRLETEVRGLPEPEFGG